MTDRDSYFRMYNISKNKDFMDFDKLKNVYLSGDIFYQNTSTGCLLVARRQTSRIPPMYVSAFGDNYIKTCFDKYKMTGRFVHIIVSATAPIPTGRM